MPLQPYPSLSVTGDFGDGQETAVFELYGGEQSQSSVSEGIENSQAVDNGINNLLGLISQLTGETGDSRAGLNVDVGGGVHTWRVDCQIPEGTTKADGTPVQWGTSATVDDPPTATSATGASPTAQRNIWTRIFEVGTPDSGQPALLEDGLYTSDSDTPFDPVPVVVKQPQAEVRGGTPRLEVTAIIQKTRDGSEAVEAAERTKRGAGL